MPDDKIEVAHRLLAEIDEMRSEQEEIPDEVIIEAKLEVILAAIQHLHEDVVP